LEASITLEKFRNFTMAAVAHPRRLNCQENKVIFSLHKYCGKRSKQRYAKKIIGMVIIGASLEQVSLLP